MQTELQTAGQDIAALGEENLCKPSRLIDSKDFRPGPNAASPDRTIFVQGHISMDKTEVNLKFRLADGLVRTRVTFSPPLTMEEVFDLETSCVLRPLRWRDAIDRLSKGRKVEVTRPQSDAA